MPFLREKRPPPRRPPWQVSTACLLLAAGCATLPHPPPSPPAHAGELRLTAQWREPAGQTIRVAEVFLENPSGRPVSLESLSLDGRPLRLPSGTPRKGGDGPAWWSVRPSATIPPGGFAVATLAFPGLPGGTLFRLSCVASGFTNAVALPRFAPPVRLVTCVTFPARDVVAVQTASGTVSPVSLSVNGEERPFLRLRDGRRGYPADVLVARLPAPVQTGDDVLVRVGFADGTGRLAAVRALCTAAIDVLRADKSARKSLGVRRSPEVTGLPPEDVGCYDLESRRFGAAVPALLANLAKVPPGDARLRAVHFCSGAVSASFGLYGAIADAAFSSSFPFERTESPAARVATAERDFLRVARTVRPRPAVWCAGLFRRGGKSFAPAEADALFWSLLALGSRGVRVYAWREKGGVEGLEALPELAGCVRRWAATLDRRGCDLSALVPADEARDGRLLVRTAWNPLSGMLVSWRTDDLAPAGPGAALRVRRPDWLAPRRAEDLATGRRAAFAEEGGDLLFHLDPNALSGAFWISAPRPDIPGG